MQNCNITRRLTLTRHNAARLLAKMTIKLYSLSGVPEDEANDIRNLLLENDIKYYETPRANWGGGLEAIWLEDKTQIKLARELLTKYQKTREVTARNKYRKLVAEGNVKTLKKRFKENPAWFAFLLIAFLVVLLGLLFGNSHRL